MCRLWTSNSSTESPYSLLFECVTAKEQIATCCTVLSGNCLVIGDSRGGISIFRWGMSDVSVHTGVCTGSQPVRLDIPIPSQYILPIDLYIPHAHGSDLVSYLLEDYDGNGFYSVGHDGCFCVFSSTGEIVSKLKCLPIKSPDQIFVIGTKKEKSFYVGGFLGGLYIVYDIRKGYQVMRIEGGGWKR